MISRYYTHPPKRYKPFKDDAQAHKVYLMERAIVGWAVDTRTPEDRMYEVARHACRRYKVDVPELKLVQEGAGPFGYTDDEGIKLNIRWHGDNMAVLLHELAHWIHDEQGLEGESHGPEFMRVYAELLDFYKMLPRECMEVLAAKYDVEIEPDVFHTCENKED